MRHVPKLLLKALKENTPHSVLDIGCGKGYLPKQLYKHRILISPYYYGIDIERQSEYCNKEISILDYKTEIKYPFIICDQVIEHIPQQLKALDNIRNLLTPDGTLFISSIIRCPWMWFSPDGAWYFYDGKLCPDHVREYESLGEFRRLLEHCGFEVTHIHERQFFLRFYIPVPGFFIVEALCRKR